MVGVGVVNKVEGGAVWVANAYNRVEERVNGRQRQRQAVHGCRQGHTGTTASLVYGRKSIIEGGGTNA